MSQKKDRRSARTRKREESDARIIATEEASDKPLIIKPEGYWSVPLWKIVGRKPDGSPIWMAVRRSEETRDRRILSPHEPKSQSSCAPMVPEVSQ